MKNQCLECNHYKQDALCIVFPQGIPKEVRICKVECLYRLRGGQ